MSTLNDSKVTMHFYKGCGYDRMETTTPGRYLYELWDKLDGQIIRCRSLTEAHRRINEILAKEVTS
jgi:hypothetical protein